MPEAERRGLVLLRLGRVVGRNRRLDPGLDDHLDEGPGRRGMASHLPEGDAQEVRGGVEAGTAKGLDGAQVANEGGSGGCNGNAGSRILLW